MNATAIKDLLATRPFEPVVFVLSSGDRYLVRHPENVMLFKERVLIAYFEEPGELPDRSINISYLHIAAVEPAPGRGARRPPSGEPNQKATWPPTP